MLTGFCALSADQFRYLEDMPLIIIRNVPKIAVNPSVQQNMVNPSS